MPALKSYTFKDTEETVQIRKVSPLLLIRLQDRYPAPKPPMQTVDYGDGPKQEPNPTAPEHLVALKEHEMAMEKHIRHLLIERGVVVDWTNERVSALAELRAWWLGEYGEPLDEPNDTVAFVSYIAIGSDVDFEELVGAIMQRSQPTEKETDKTLERLKS